MKKLVCGLILLALALGCAAGSAEAKGVWWWRGADARNAAEAEKRFAFLARQGVNEIYFWVDGQTSTEELVRFVRTARAKGFSVSWLSGDVSWIDPGCLGFEEVWARYRAYQKAAPADARFTALHLDVEPHQNAKLSKARKWQLYADFVLRATALVHRGGEKLEWDIPFWLDGIQVARGDKTDASLLELVMDVSDGVVLMSYRDTAKAMLDTAKQELDFAATRTCRVLLGAETGKSGEGDFVSYYEEGAAAMAAELDKVQKALAARNLKVATGVAVHHVGSWMALTAGPGNEP